MFRSCHHLVVCPLLLVIVAFEARSSQAPWNPTDCPEQCVCKAEDSLRKVYCDIRDNKYRDLTAVPETFPIDAQFISLSRNKIATIPVGTFANLPQLRYLVLASNEIQSLPKNVFHGLTKLESLNVANNKLSILPSGLLSGLSSLQDLYLDGNVLENLPANFFKGLTSLRRLLLNNNKFHTFSQQVFGFPGEEHQFRTHTTKPTTVTPVTLASANLTSLVELRLNHNGIGQVDNRSFQRMSDLRQLKLNDNNISTLPRGVFRELKSLRLLSLYNNPFQCTCSLRWLKHWILKKKLKNITVFHVHKITCHGPPWLRNKPLVYVKDRDFGCRGKPWTGWSSWTSCSKNCGSGKQSRSRNCTTGYHRRECKGVSRQWRVCNSHSCDPDWSRWSQWTPCTKSCNFGSRTRSRSTKCIHSPCQRQVESEIQSCKGRECPVHNGWSSWSPWSGCSRTCGLGHKSRHRRCTNPVPQHGGSQCKGRHVEVIECVHAICKDDFSPWSSWSECSTQCGIGVQVRRRNCTKLDPTSGLGICLGDKKMYRKCEEDKSCSTGQWSQWSDCIGECKHGQKVRLRSCKNSLGQSGNRCQNKTREYQYQQCRPTKCRYKPIWSGWSNWSECSKTCSRGSRRRKRVCLTRVIGKNCPGSYEDKEPCNIHPCPVHGGWNVWSSWSECTQRCGEGRKWRNRTCNNPPPIFNGHYCIGDSSEFSTCNSNKCSDLTVGDAPYSTTKIPTKVPIKNPITLKKPKDCPKPEKPEHGRFVIRRQRDHYTYLEYKCDPLYRYQGPSQLQHCSDKGEWSGQPGECVPDCGEIGNNALPGKRLTKDGNIMNMDDSWPWQVAISVPIRGVNCGGSLVGDEWIITAAHCVLKKETHQKTEKYKNIEVYLGTNSVSQTNLSLPGVQNIGVKEVYTHEDFNWEDYESDIAILKLERKVNITERVHPVCLPTSKRRRRLAMDGKKGVMVGWGSKERHNILRQIPLPVVKLSDCRESYKQLNKRWKVTNKMLCAGDSNGNRDTCKRDSGGGFHFLDKNGRKVRWVLGGIVSWGYPRCGEPGKYSVFTNVARHIRWIRDIISRI